jgi:LPS export ABC transporter protein LptC
MILNFDRFYKKEMKKLRIILGLIILGSLAVVGLMTWRTIAPRHEKIETAKGPASSADLKLDRVHYTETREGVKEWELEATCAQYFKEEGTVFFDKVKATFFGKNGEKYVLVGEKGKFNTQTKAIEVFNGIRLNSSDGYQMRTRSLKYLAEKRELSTSDAVEITGPQLRVEGIGLIVELDRQQMKVLRQVTTTLSQAGVKDSFRAPM